MENNQKSEKQIEKQKQNQNLEKLLKKNLAVSQEILDISNYIRKYVFWRKVTGIIKIFLIAIPIILGIIYLPPTIEKGLNNINDSLNLPLTGNTINQNCENE